ncbi:MAG: hypothetical protein ACT4TC_09245 [Myxococcaceae bacterium]
MKTIWEHIGKRQAKFAGHLFFAWLERAHRLDSLAAFAPALTFWPLAFQDLLRLNEMHAKDPRIRSIVHHHRLEDAGHEQWFLEDLGALDKRQHDPRWLFSEENAAGRDASYAILSEVFRAQDDRQRIVLLLTLESAGQVFFSSVVSYVERTGHASELKYFSRDHLRIEQGHSMFSDGAPSDALPSFELSEHHRKEGRKVVDRVYSTLEALLDELLPRIAASVRQRQRAPEATEHEKHA